MPYWPGLVFLTRLATLPSGQSGFTRRFGIRYRGLFGNYLLYYRVGGSGEGPLKVLALLKPPVRSYICAYIVFLTGVSCSFFFFFLQGFPVRVIAVHKIVLYKCMYIISDVG